MRPKEGKDGPFKLGDDNPPSLVDEEVVLHPGEEIDGYDLHGKKDLNRQEDYFCGGFPFDINQENVDQQGEHGG